MIPSFFNSVLIASLTTVSYGSSLSRKLYYNIEKSGFISTSDTDVINNSEIGYYVIAKNSNEIMGSLMITYEWSDWRNGMFWWIQSVYVEKEFRKQGVYKQMYLYIKEKAKNDNSCTGIRLYVEKENKVAQSVYKKLGMDETYYKLFEVDFQN